MVFTVYISLIIMEVVGVLITHGISLLLSLLSSMYLLPFHGYKHLKD